MIKTNDIKFYKCVGCGFCCIQAKCAAGQRLYPSADVCPALTWSDSDNRYFCDLMTIPGKIGFEYRQELYEGAGCCSNLNSWRNDVKNRSKIKKEEICSLDPIFQKFLHQLGREFMSSDCFYLALYGLQGELISEGNDIEETKNLMKLIQHNFKNSRSKFNEEFMG
jgi:hypothetical protein